MFLQTKIMILKYHQKFIIRDALLEIQELEKNKFSASYSYREFGKLCVYKQVKYIAFKNRSLENISENIHTV